MTGDTGFVEATDRIVLAGSNMKMSREKEIEGTVTYMLPGALVKMGSTDNEVAVGSDGVSAVGWLGYRDTSAMWRPKNIDTAYVLGDRAGVVSGPGMIIRGKLADNMTIAYGDKLTGTANGALKEWVPIATTPANELEQFVVAIAMESKTTSGAAANLIVKSVI
jgi:hypothetical protein